MITGDEEEERPEEGVYRRVSLVPVGEVPF